VFIFVPLIDLTCSKNFPEVFMSFREETEGLPRNTRKVCKKYLKFTEKKTMP